MRLYAELNDLVRRADDHGRYRVPVDGSRSVKDAIESLGVPHTEVDLVLRNGRSVDFAAAVTAGDRLAVYPVFEALDVGPVQRVRPQPLRDPRFVLDVHLGTLARNLRLLGLDAAYRNDADDAALARLSVEQHRILLTRDRGLLMRGVITHGHLVRDDDPFTQTVEVLRRFDLSGRLTPLRRCLACGARLEPVDKREIDDRLPPRTRVEHDHFTRCSDCGRLYWPGSHRERLQTLIADLTAAIDVEVGRHRKAVDGHRR